MIRLKVIFLSIFLISVAACSEKSGEKTEKKAARIDFKETGHDFGKIQFGGDGSYEFVFKNTGKSPLILDNVKSTCGCTVPEWPREPVAASGSGFIRVIYDTHRAGAFSKTLVVFSNASNSPVRLFIKGEVLPYEKSPADSVKIQ
jgi:hypothetical protein